MGTDAYARMGRPQISAGQLSNAQAGFALIEVLVSAVIAMLIAGAVFGLLESTARSASEERRKSVAYAIAQEDQAHLRAMQVASLNNLSQTSSVTLDGTPYTVESQATFVNDATGTSSCGRETSSADYVQIASTVTWPSIGAGSPVKIQSIVAPPNGSLDPTHGTLTVSVENAQGKGVPGIGLTGTGAGSFSGTTNSEGCGQFADQPAGNYTLTPSGPAGTVEKDGNPPAPQAVSVVAGTTSTVALQLDQAGSVTIAFKTKVGTKLVSSSADSVVAFNTGMSSAKTFGTPGGPREGSRQATPLFPFTSPDTLYAGACGGNNPNPSGETAPPGAAAIANVLVPAGGSANATIQLPALNLTVWSGTSAAPGARVEKAHVTVSDLNCMVSGQPVKRVYSTDSNGALLNPISGKPDPGLPWSSYDVCVDNGLRQQVATSVAVKNLIGGTTLPVYLTGLGSSLGTCP